jgi:hypothetical protein
MRAVLLFVTGILVGMAIQPGWAQQGHIVGLNHVAISVADYAAATDFYGSQMPHFGLEVGQLDSAVEQLRGRGVQVRPPSVSPRTGSRIAIASGPGGINLELLEFGAESPSPEGHPVVEMRTR